MTSAPSGTHNGDTSHLFAFTGVSANKAGMGADKRLVSEFVFERSRNSQYTQHQLDLDAKQRARTELVAADLRDAEARMTAAERLADAKKTEEALAALEKQRDLSRTYCVVDMDMFFAAVEILDQPHLATKPVAVGGLGMISTANYVARLYGVRSAMPGFIAVEMVRNPLLVGSKMPPDELTFIPPDFGKYTRVATEAREVFRDYDANFHSWSLDEANLDLTDYLASRGGADAAEQVVQELRSRVKERTGGLTCSAGIGPNPMLAKMASEDHKPDGQTRIAPTRDDVLRYIQDLPVRRVPGCGKVLEHQIGALFGATTCGELRVFAAKVRRAFVGKKTCEFLLRACLGISGQEVAEEEGEEIGSVGRKSLSSERTFRAEAAPQELRARLCELCREVAEEMAASVPALACRVVALKTKTASFELRSRQVSFSRPIGYGADFGRKDLPQTKKPISETTDAEGASTSENAVESEERTAVAAAWETKVAQVADELRDILMPLLEGQLPCTFRLMGVRVSSFRDQRASLQRGQKQLASFFHASAGNRRVAAHLENGNLAAATSTFSSGYPTLIDLGEDSEEGDCEQNGIGIGFSSSSSAPPREAVDAGLPPLAGLFPPHQTSAVSKDNALDTVNSNLFAPSHLSRAYLQQQAPVVVHASQEGHGQSLVSPSSSSGLSTVSILEVLDDNDEPTFLQVSGDMSSIPSSTICPVCGIRVAVHDADGHVNGHYDQPATPSLSKSNALLARLHAGAAAVAMSSGHGKRLHSDRPPTERQKRRRM